MKIKVEIELELNLDPNEEILYHELKGDFLNVITVNTKTREHFQRRQEVRFIPSAESFSLVENVPRFGDSWIIRGDLAMFKYYPKKVLQAFKTQYPDIYMDLWTKEGV